MPSYSMVKLLFTEIDDEIRMVMYLHTAKMIQNGITEQANGV